MTHRPAATAAAEKNVVDLAAVRTARGRVRAVPAQPAANPAPYRRDGTARGALEYLCGVYGVPT